MAGSLIGGKKAAKTNKERHGEDFYQRIGAIGGEAGTTGGFAKKKACDCDVFNFAHTKPQCAGSKGGSKSRRGKSVI